MEIEATTRTGSKQSLCEKKTKREDASRNDLFILSPRLCLPSYEPEEILFGEVLSAHNRTSELSARSR
jgi:hypothetical protein